MIVLFMVDNVRDMLRNLIEKAQRYVSDAKINDALHILEINRDKFANVDLDLRFDYLIVLGYILIVRGELLKAEKVVEEAIRISRKRADRSGRAKCYYLMSLIFHRRGELDKSNRRLKVAIRLLVDSRDIRLKMSILQVLVMNSYLLNRRLDSELLKELKKNTGVFERYIEALSKYNSGYYEEALQDIQYCKKEWKKRYKIYLAETYFLSAQILYKSGKLKKALIDARKAVEIAINIKDKIGLARAQLLLGTISRDLGKMDEAKEAFHKAERLFSKMDNWQAEYVAKMGRETLER